MTAPAQHVDSIFQFQHHVEPAPRAAPPPTPVEEAPISHEVEDTELSLEVIERVDQARARAEHIIVAELHRMEATFIDAMHLLEARLSATEAQLVEMQRRYDALLARHPPNHF